MELKDIILSITTGTDTSKKTGKPYTFADILFKGDDGTVVRKRIFFQDFEKALLKMA